MKKYNLILLGLASFVLLFWTSCKPDKKDPAVPTPTGDIRDQMVGNWTCKEASRVFNSTTFTVGITKSTANSQDIIVSNFYNLGTTKTINAQVVNPGINIYNQNVSGYIISGSGTINSTALMSWNYNVNDGAGTDTCSAILNKQ